MHHFGFIGFGLIGGSVAHALREQYPDSELMAYNYYITKPHPRLELAAMDGILDKITTDLADFADCDCIFLCAPVIKNIAYLDKLLPYLSKDCLLTDVGSVKSDILAAVREHGLCEQFVGGHPMTGSEKTGYESSTDHLLENAYYIITPTARSTPEQIDRIREVALAIGALPLVLDYHEHDFSVAAISHLPHLVASSLVNLVHDNDSKDEIMKRLAAGGFKDITRIASSSPVMWEQICMTNTENILTLLKRYIASLESICDTLEHHDGSAIYRMFEESGKYRSSFPNRGRGPIERDYSFSVDVLDEPGSISVLSAILAAKGISVKNMGINHSREEGEGALRISFYKEEQKNEAASLLKSHNYVLTK